MKYNDKELQKIQQINTYLNNFPLGLKLNMSKLMYDFNIGNKQKHLLDHSLIKQRIELIKKSEQKVPTPIIPNDDETYGKATISIPKTRGKIEIPDSFFQNEVKKKYNITFNDPTTGVVETSDIQKPLENEYFDVVDRTDYRKRSDRSKNISPGITQSYIRGLDSIQQEYKRHVDSYKEEHAKMVQHRIEEERKMYETIISKMPLKNK